MSEKTNPIQLIDANKNVIPYEAAQDALIVNYEGGANVRYLANSRPNVFLESEADFHRKAHFRIARFTYSGNKIIKKELSSGNNFYDKSYDNQTNFLTITAITQANPGVCTLSAITWPNGSVVQNGDKIEFTDATGMTQVNNNFYFVSGWSPGPMTFNMHVGNDLNADIGTNVDTSAFGVYAGNGIAHKRTFANTVYA